MRGRPLPRAVLRIFQDRCGCLENDGAHAIAKHFARLAASEVDCFCCMGAVKKTGMLSNMVG